MKVKKRHLYFTLIAFATIIYVFVMRVRPDYNMSLFRSKSIDKEENIKYVLQWTPSKSEPFVYMRQGQEKFIKLNCSIKDCFITSDRYLLFDITNFDVILFHGPELYRPKAVREMPKIRSVKQSYIFVSMESSDNYPVDEKFNGFFNLTWTYKLSSDIYYGYVIIKNNNDEVVGPRIDMDWMNINDMLPVNDMVKMKLANKKIAAAWFVSNCHTRSGREQLASRIKKEMEKYNMSLDIYGKCGNHKCPFGSMNKCLEMIQRDYYFYFAFENSVADDYVTEKLLHALRNYAVPVVFGGANYSRFMPNGIYLNAFELTVEELVSQMFELINDKRSYHNFFKWHNHYSYHYVEKSSDTNYYCKFCEHINREEFANHNSSITNFDEWWNS